MKRTALAYSLVTALAFGLGACSKQEATAPTAAPAAAVKTPAETYDLLAAKGKGFTVGSMMAANVVYVMFDPQCPHCGHLWKESQPLHKKIRMVWIPVSFINGKSGPQGAAIMSASNPVEFMTAHEASILAGTGGTPLPDSVSPELEAAIKTNTEVFNSLKVESVPYIVAKNVRTGQAVTNSGALTTAALAEFLGIEP